ncbi:MAG: DNA methyltransferase [Bacteroidota bacterium]
MNSIPPADDLGNEIKHNKLNDLHAKPWLKFQKSWFIHNPPPRKRNVKRHPAKFPETLVEEFVSFFTKRGQTVLDPMAGTGSSLVAAISCGRVGLGVELMDKYAAIAGERVAEALALAEDPGVEQSRVITGDASKLSELGLPPIDYCITSPPYWDMLRCKGAHGQQKRRDTDGWDVHYSDDERDLGNVEDYEEFVGQLVAIYRQVATVLRDGAYLTVIVKNVKKGGTIYPLAWDLGREVGRFLKLKDEKIWCQDNQPLFPFAMGKCWVSNTMHQYCLNWRKE